jgi:hypothetical protein
MSQVTRKGEKPASSPALEAELWFRHKAAKRAPTDADRPPVSTFPGPKPKVHDDQLELGESA